MSDVLSRVNWNTAANDILVTIAVGSHLFPFRTEKLSPPAPMILQFLWESRGRLFKESYSNVTLLFFVFVHIAPYLLHKTHQSCVAVRKVLSPQLFFSLCAKYTALSAQNLSCAYVNCGFSPCVGAKFPPRNREGFLAFYSTTGWFAQFWCVASRL